MDRDGSEDDMEVSNASALPKPKRAAGKGTIASKSAGPSKTTTTKSKMSNGISLTGPEKMNPATMTAAARPPRRAAAQAVKKANTYFEETSDDEMDQDDDDGDGDDGDGEDGEEDGGKDVHGNGDEDENEDEEDEDEDEGYEDGSE